MESRSLSIVMPFYKKASEFTKALKFNEQYFRGHEVVICMDDDTDLPEAVSLRGDKGWKIIVNRKLHAWRNPAKAINVGIRNSTGNYVMVCSPESVFVGDVPNRLLQLAEMTNSVVCGTVSGSTKDFDDAHEELFKIRMINPPPLFYGSIIFPRKSAEKIGGYDECFPKWGGEDDNFRARLIMDGGKIMKSNLVSLIHIGPLNQHTEKNFNMSSIVKPTLAVCESCSKSWGTDFSEFV